MAVVFDLQRLAELVHRRCIRLGERLYGYGLFQVEVTHDAYRLMWGAERLGDYSNAEELDAAVESLLDGYRASFQGPEAPADGYRSVWRRLLAVSRNHPGGDWIPLAELAPMFGGNEGLGYALSRLRAEKHLSFTDDGGTSWRLSLGTATRVYQTGKYRAMRVWAPIPGGTGDFYATFKVIAELSRKNGRALHRSGCNCVACDTSRSVLPTRMLTDAQFKMVAAVENASSHAAYFKLSVELFPPGGSRDMVEGERGRWLAELDRCVKAARRGRVPDATVERAILSGRVAGERDFRCGRQPGGSRENIRLPGGRAQAQGKQLSDFNRADLLEGQAHELEHTSDVEAATWIAADHLTEDPDYYRKLAQLEARGTPRRRR